MPLTTTHAKRALSISLLVALSSCSMLEPEKLRQASVGATDHIAGANSLEASKSVLPAQMPTVMTITKDGTTKMEFAPSSSATVKAESQQTASAFGNSATQDSSKFTTGQKMILWGIGLVAIVVALVIAWKYVSKTAVGAGISAGDTALGQLISHIQSKAALTTDPVVSAHMQDLKATAENLRGKLNNPSVK